MWLLIEKLSRFVFSRLFGDSFSVLSFFSVSLVHCLSPFVSQLHSLCSSGPDYFICQYSHHCQFSITDFHATYRHPRVFCASLCSLSVISCK